MAGNVTGIANVGVRWNGGDLEYYNKTSGDTIASVKADGTFDVATAGKLTVAASEVADASSYLGGITPGTSAASKAVVLDSSSKIDALDITALKLNGTSVSATAAQINTLTQKGAIQIPITGARVIDTNDIANASLVTKNTDPILERSNAATDKSLRLSWASGSVIEVALPSICYPPDLDDAANVVVHLLAKMKAASVDTPVISVGAFEGVGDTNFGGNTGALSTTLQHLTVTLTASNVGPYPTMLALTLTPGAHNTASNDVYVYGVWVEYTRK